MGGSSSKEGNYGKSSSFGSNSSEYNRYESQPSNSYIPENQPYPVQQPYTPQQAYAPEPSYGGIPNQQNRKLDRRYSRIADGYSSLDQGSVKDHRKFSNSSNHLVWIGSKQYSISHLDDQ